MNMQVNQTQAPDKDADVIIVGGGPVGMGLAIELGQRGIRCIVVERYAKPQPIPKGQNLTQRTMEHFHAWGAEKELRAARTIPPEYGIGGLTAYNTLLGSYSYDWLQRDLVKPYYFTANERLPQYATEAVLRDRAAELPSVETFYGWNFDSLRQDDEGVSVTVSEKNGSDSKTLRASYVVGCDGARSGVRQQAGITQTKTDHDRLMVLLVFRSQGLHKLLERFPGKSYYNVLQPELKGYWKFFGRVDLGNTWFFHAPVPPGTTADNFDFQAYLEDAVGASFDVEFEHIGFWDLRFMLADSYRSGRVFIAGDAAHSQMGPQVRFMLSSPTMKALQLCAVLGSRPSAIAVPRAHTYSPHVPVTTWLQPRSTMAGMHSSIWGRATRCWQPICLRKRLRRFDMWPAPGSCL